MEGPADKQVGRLSISLLAGVMSVCEKTRSAQIKRRMIGKSSFIY